MSININIVLLVAAIATNVGWAILSNWINRSLKEERDRMSDVWADLSQKQLDAIVILQDKNKALKEQNKALKEQNELLKEAAGYEETK